MPFSLNPLTLLSVSICSMTSLTYRQQRSPSSSRHKGLPLLTHLLIAGATILSQSLQSESTSAAYRHTKYTAFQNVYATKIPLATASEATILKCGQLCLQIPSCSGFNYLRSPSKSGGSCDPKTDPKGSTCEFLDLKRVTGVPFAQGA